MFRRFFASSAIVASLLAVAACSSPANGSGPGLKEPEPDPAPVVSVASDATAGEKLQLSVSQGEFVSVELTDNDHDEVPVDEGTFDTTIATPDATGTAEPSDDTGTNDESDSNEDNADDANAGGNVETNIENENTDSATDPTDGATTDAATDSADDDTQSGPQGGAKDTNPKGNAWESNYTLAGAASYTWKATTVSPDGATHEATGTVKTKKPKGDSMRMWSVLDDDMKVGVGAPIIFNFAEPIPEDYRAGIESRLSVEVTNKKGKPRKVEGSWAWLPDDDGHSRIHYRPKKFWPAHSKVHVSAPVKNVPYSEDRYGAKDITLDFTIAREQIAVADAKKHTFVVERSGKTVMDFPASLGAPKSPSYNGTHIVMSKSRNYTMTSERWGYTTPVTHAVRIHNNGEFIHAAPWSVGSQGNSNVSHGCVNLSTENASEYFDSALFGDPVKVKGSSVSLTTSSGDINDWVYKWSEWKKLSALKK